jgi:hypothetical protein
VASEKQDRKEKTGSIFGTGEGQSIEAVNHTVLYVQRSSGIEDNPATVAGVAVDGQSAQDDNIVITGIDINAIA